MWTGCQSESAPFPTRREWLEYLGEYRVNGADGGIRATVFLRNGQLYVRYNIACGQPGMRLTAFCSGAVLHGGRSAGDFSKRRHDVRPDRQRKGGVGISHW